MDITDGQHEVAAVLAVVREHAAAAERRRRLPEEMVAALRATGINRLLIPEEMGGLDAPVADILGIVEQVAAVDCSTKWRAVMGNGSNLFACYLHRAGAGQVFADAMQSAATMLAPGRHPETTRARPPADRAVGVHQPAPRAVPPRRTALGCGDAAWHRWSPQRQSRIVTTRRLARGRARHSRRLRQEIL
ncbi:MAG TPA: acyl-CoA dehydrogenase family protein [Acidimicrobiales bacterium]